MQSTVDRQLKERQFRLVRERTIRQARKSFWMYCKTVAPDFYIEGRVHLHNLCTALQALYEGKLTARMAFDLGCEVQNGVDPDYVFKKFMLNMPPRHGKSRTLTLFCQWIYGKNFREMIISGSYNDTTATEFSRFTRDGISARKLQPHEIDYSDIFPGTMIKRGDSAVEKWALEGRHFSYKGAGVGGSITGSGCTIAITDDLLKGAEQAYSSNALEKIWVWYTGTFLSRQETDCIEIMNGTRWAKHDPCGKVLMGKNAHKWCVMKMKAYDETKGKGDAGMLCPALLTHERYMDILVEADANIASANYQQIPVDAQGAVYKNLKTYEGVPVDDDGNVLFDRIISYTDTADEGKDFLCSICAGVYDGEAYILDVIYTQDGMEITEPATAKMLFKNKVKDAKIESNNGGKGFARNVRRHLKQDHKTRMVGISWFHQSKNKIARILSHSTFVMNHVYFPVNWRDKWPEFYYAITGHQQKGKNEHDDAPDTITGIAEMIDNPRKSVAVSAPC